MSIVVRAKRVLAPVIVPAEEKAEVRPRRHLTSYQPEAPDRGYTDREAAEMATSGRSTTEAPEAGEGRAGYLHEESSHGRSRS